jgi:Flp pilus assembly CpaF family ATPase
MNPAKIAEDRASLLFKKSEGKATESGLKQLNKLAKLIKETKAGPVITEEDKSFLEYAKKMIAALENRSANDEPTATRKMIDVYFTKMCQVPA